MRGCLEIEISRAGAVVDVYLGVSELRRKALQQRGVTPPHPVQVSLLIDTGATCSWVDESYMARNLGLEPRGWEQVHTVHSRGVPDKFFAYDASLTIGGYATEKSRHFQIQICTQPFINQPFDGLLGRDVLNKCRLGWNGPSCKLRFEYD